MDVAGRRPGTTARPRARDRWGAVVAGILLVAAVVPVSALGLLAWFRWSGGQGGSRPT